MRVLYLTQWFEPEPAFKGAAFARALAEAGCEVQVATGFPNYPGGKLYPGYRIRPFAREAIEGVSVHRLPLWPSHDRSMLGRMANYLSFFLSTLTYCLFTMRRYDIVYVYHPPVTPAIAAAIAGMVHRTPFIVEIQDLWPDSVDVSGMAAPRLIRILDRLCSFVYRRAAHIVCQSDGMVERLTERGVPRDKLTRIYNWSNYQPGGEDGAAIPESIERAFAGRINMVYGGNIGQAQALEHLVEAGVLAAREVPALRLHIIGNGIERDRIAALAARAPDAVVLHSPVPRQTMDRIFERADILALHLGDSPLFDITIPSKLQHYLSVGKPIVAGINGEAARLLTQSGAALVSHPGAIDDLRRNIVALARLDPADRTAMGAAGQTYYQQKLSFAAALQRSVTLLRTHCKKARPADASGGNTMSQPPDQLLIVQPALPAYRHDFFSRLARKLGGRLRVYYSPADMGALTAVPVDFAWARRIGPIRPLLPGLEWQQGAWRIPLHAGDTLVLSGNPRCLSTLALLLKARLRGVRTIWWGHYWSSSSRRHRFLLRMALMRLTDEVLFYADREVADYHRTWLGRRDRRPLHALNNGIDVVPIAARRQPYDARRRERTILFIGRLTPKAKLELLLSALAGPELASVHLEVLGDGEERARLRQLAGELGIAARVHWHGGSTEETHIAAVANRCRLFAYPGAVGLSLIHAMAYGLPAIVHGDRWRHMPEIAAFAPGKTGLSFAADDAGSLGDAIAALIDDPERLQRMSTAARQVADGEFNTATMAERLAAVVGRRTLQAGA